MSPIFASVLKFVFKKREETAAKARRQANQTNRDGGDGNDAGGTGAGGGDGGDGDKDVKPFLDHLEDLRWTVLKIAVTLVLSMTVCFIWHTDVFKFLQHPLRVNGYDPTQILVSETLIGPFMTALTLSFYAGIVVSFPFLMYFLGEFILPALTKKEKTYALPAIGVGFLLFLSGAAFCFYYVTPSVVKFMAEFTIKNGQKVQYTVKSYYGFVSMMSIAFGLLCQLPVVMVTLNGIGIVSYKWIAGTRSYAIASIFTLVVFVSPAPDVFSILMFSLPLVGLYEICIWIIWYLDRRRAQQEAVEARRLSKPYEDDKNEPID